jgi:hypothetical protein
MNRPPRLTSAIAALAVALALGPSVGAAEPELDRFRSEIETFISRLEPSTNGMVKWAGSDPYEIRRDGDALVATIANPRLAFHAPEFGRLTFDRIEIRRTGQKDAGKLIELAILLPREGILLEADGGETRLTLKDGSAEAEVEAETGRGRATAISIATARIEQPRTDAWIGFGPLAMTSKLVATPDGGWRGPVDFEVKAVEFSFPQLSGAGVIDRIAFAGESSGPKMEALDALRDALDALRTDVSRNDTPEARLARFWAIFQTVPTTFGTIQGKAVLAGLKVREAGGETLLALANAEIASEIAGLDGDMAAIRLSMREDGLELAPSLLDGAKVPRRVVVDLGLANLSTRALRDMLQTAAAARNGSSAGDQQTAAATQELLGDVAMLDPVFRINDIAFDTRDVAVELTAEAKGSPLMRKGYTAEGDLVVRGFDRIPGLGIEVPFAEYLPVLKELGVEDKTSDEPPRLKFHLASAPPKWLTVNGNDITAWFEASEAMPGQPRLLKPSDPPMQGNDVMGVQHALAAAKIPVAQDGVFSPATAAAVARFQKEQGMNVNGAVDAVTRQRLGMTADTPRQGGRN